MCKETVSIADDNLSVHPCILQARIESKMDSANQPKKCKKTEQEVCATMKGHAVIYVAASFLITDL